MKNFDLHMWFDHILSSTKHFKVSTVKNNSKKLTIFLLFVKDSVVGLTSAFINFFCNQSFFFNFANVKGGSGDASRR